MSDQTLEALQTPPTEIEISEVLLQLPPAQALILRRLCLQRDTALAALDREREEAMAIYLAGWRAGREAAVLAYDRRAIPEPDPPTPPERADEAEPAG